MFVSILRMISIPENITCETSNRIQGVLRKTCISSRLSREYPIMIKEEQISIDPQILRDSSMFRYITISSILFCLSNIYEINIK